MKQNKTKINKTLSQTCGSLLYPNLAHKMFSLRFAQGDRKWPNATLIHSAIKNAAKLK